ncbi:MAG: isoprenylcysteine carboxylmethyltransferase family protein [Gemmatimonadales bacterium]|jgi:protein-S-isoprenylcysteine O-methyltransferase Ste14
MLRHCWMHAGSVLALATVGTSLVLREPGLPELRVMAVGTGILSIILMFAPIHTLKRYGNVPPDATYMGTTRVVDSGLFGVVRHPQYSGYVLLCITFVLVSQHVVVTALAIPASVCFYLQAMDEEVFLVERLGEPYEQYKARVPRFNFLLGLYRLLR